MRGLIGKALGWHLKVGFFRCFGHLAWLAWTCLKDGKVWWFWCISKVKVRPVVILWAKCFWGVLACPIGWWQPVGFGVGSEFDGVHVLRWIIGLKVGFWWLYKATMWSAWILRMGPMGIVQVGCFKVVWMVTWLSWQKFRVMAWKMQVWKDWCTRYDRWSSSLLWWANDVWAFLKCYRGCLEVGFMARLCMVWVLSIIGHVMHKMEN